MNSSCCYSSSNSPSLRFFDLHTVRHFAVKISCLGNIILPFSVPGLPNVKSSVSGSAGSAPNDAPNLNTKPYKSQKTQE